MRLHLVVLGLSGGIDSALTAALAADALGPSQVTGVAMPTRYSSQHSLDDAEALARNLGIAYRVVPIDGVFQSYLDALRPALPASLGVAEENIQARIRGATLMAFSNTEGAMLLSTGNKSELAVGYCTLYGDMCGGLAVISDVPKTLVYDLARYVNREHEIIPRSSLTKAPSAELRPNQTDQDTLPPYDVIDRVIEGYIERDLDLASIVASGIDRAVAEDIVGRIDRNEYKRRQAAPGLKITSKAFGVGRRYPIAARYDATLPAAPEAARPAGVMPAPVSPRVDPGAWRRPAPHRDAVRAVADGHSTSGTRQRDLHPGLRGRSVAPSSCGSRITTARSRLIRNGILEDLAWLASCRRAAARRPRSPTRPPLPARAASADGVDALRQTVRADGGTVGSELRGRPPLSRAGLGPGGTRRP